MLDLAQHSLLGLCPTGTQALLALLPDTSNSYWLHCKQTLQLTLLFVYITIIAKYISHWHYSIIIIIGTTCTIRTQS